jgi:hypothetical protein
MGALAAPWLLAAPPVAVLALAGVLPSVAAVGEGALQPANVSAAADTSDKTILRMGNLINLGSKHESRPAQDHATAGFAGEAPSIA